MARRRKGPNLKKILICISAIMLSPVIASLAVNSFPMVAGAAEKAAIISAGITLAEGGKLAIENELLTYINADTVDEIYFDAQGLVELNDDSSDETKDEEKAKEKKEEKKEGNRDGKIIFKNYGASKGTRFINLDVAGQVRNATSVKNATLIKEAKKKPDFKIKANKKPEVLIMHTHTTEGFEPYERDYYDNSHPSRTKNLDKNVAKVGEALAKKLENAGIGVIHDKTIHDSPSYNGSYERSAETVKKILKENPTIKVVLDIHRDAIQQQNGDRIAPIAEINGKKAAQVMIISGCDDGTMNMPNYLKNFRLASLFQQQIENDNKGLTRAVLFDYRKYNQDLTTGSLLIEVGAYSNSLDHAVYSAELIGDSIAKALLSLK
ncbi:MAG: stage II sporulation protein P [Clostridiales bacterium]|nr:stage II sporulation protein P [Clostridiales bacterium]